MTSQVLLVGMDQALAKVEELLDGLGCSLHLVDTLDECMEMASVTGADMIIASTSEGGIDPLDVVARCCTEIPQGDPPFVFMDPEDPERTRVVRRMGSPPGEFAVSHPRRSELARVMKALVSGEGVAPGGGAEIESLRDQLLAIGFNDNTDVDDRSFTVQTEVSPSGEGVIVRSKVYEAGQIVLVREFPADLGDDPIANVERLARDVHGESCFTVVLQLAERGE